jgi:hypothetical protein
MQPMRHPVHIPVSKKSEPKVTPEPLRVPAKPGEDTKVVYARTALRPSVRAAITSQTYSKQFGELDLPALVEELAKQNAAVSKGEMGRAEAMLMSQAHALEAIFHELARRSASNMGEYLGAAETYMRLALKAQSQCRASLETLAAIKNPAAITFVKQANVAHGPQQVNNGNPSAGESSRARESENRPNELLEQQHGKGLDGGALCTSSSSNTPLGAVAAVHRPEDGGGQESDLAQRL